MAFKMNGFSAFTKVIDDKEIKKLSEESKISIPEIKGVIKEMSDTGGGGMEDDFTYDDVKNAVMEKFDQPDHE
tara:strand:- start:764 stop:982 length:219 start_codon:yes stop_codon:yes gene_type:complete